MDGMKLGDLVGLDHLEASPVVTKALAPKEAEPMVKIPVSFIQSAIACMRQVAYRAAEMDGLIRYGQLTLEPGEVAIYKAFMAEIRNYANDAQVPLLRGLPALPNPLLVSKPDPIPAATSLTAALTEAATEEAAPCPELAS